MDYAAIALVMQQWRARNPLRQWRVEQAAKAGRKIPAADIAILLATTGSSLQNWESGLERPKPENMARIASLLSHPAEHMQALWDAWWAERPTAESIEGDGGTDQVSA